MNQTLVLIGFMGSGKSCVGQLLAAHFACPHHDLDALIETAAGCSIPDYFAQHDETAFRALETAQLRVALENRGVLSTGGGVVTQSDNRRLLQNSSATVVYLRATPRTLAQRIRRQPGTRPLIDGQGALNLKQTTRRVRELLEQRAPWYEECADVIVESKALSAHHVTNEIVAQISRYDQEQR